MYIHLTDGQICQTLISVGSIVNLKKKTRTVGTGEYSSNVGFKDNQMEDSSWSSTHLETAGSLALYMRVVIKRVSYNTRPRFPR